MTLKQKLLHYFLPSILLFAALNWASTYPRVQLFYHSFFEQISLRACTAPHPEIYFKTKDTNTTTKLDELTILFNSKEYLRKLIEAAKLSGRKGAYDYKGFIIYINETYVIPLIFFVSLVALMPMQIAKKIAFLILGCILIIGFAYLTVYFKSISIIADSGVTGIDYFPKELEFYRLRSYVFSSVTTISIALLLWFPLFFTKIGFMNQTS